MTWPEHAQPVFAGSWFRYPPSPFVDSLMFPMPDDVLLSHTHPDHAGLETLLQVRKDVKVLAVDFPSGAMRRRVELAGLDVQWVTAWQRTPLATDLTVTFVPNDQGWEVASMVIEAESHRAHHGNDNPLSVAGYQEVVRRLGPIELAFLPYAGASSYPTGFFAPGSKPAVEAGLRGDEDEVFSLAENELAAIVMGPLTWEDVWYGYRVHVTKRPGAGHFNELSDLLLGFDDEALSTALRAELAP